MRRELFGTGLFQLIFSFLFGLLLLSSHTSLALAQDVSPTPVDRTSKIEVDQTEYHWQILFQSDKSPACDFVVDHDGPPTDEEIQNSCSQNLFQDLKNTQPCVAGAKNCTGLLLQSLSSAPVHKKIEVLLSPPTVWVSLTGCDYAANDNYCTGQPELVFSGEEPLPNESIIKIEGDMAGAPFACDGDKCQVKLNPSTSQGSPVTFWGDSSFGDSTAHFSAFVRVIPVDNTPNAYNIDVISDQWRGKSPPSCSDIWRVFPESLDLPAWLDTPKSAPALSSSDTLYFLSAALINNGLVDASNCNGNGLSDAITANECGVTMAAPKAQYWQNLFDQEIFSVAQIDGVPAQLLKNIFLRESQLWPGIYHDIKEVGLGQLTDNGADTALLWNQSFFNSFCPLVLDKSVCAFGYANMGEERQAILRGALLRKTNAACPDCSEKIDLTKVDFSIHVFAETLKANCNQVNQLIVNTTQKSPREVSSYDDLWRFTLVNYNAGPGCLGNAITRTWNANLPIDWSHVMTNIDPVCQSAVNYVVDISKGSTLGVTAFSTPLPTGTLTPTQMPTLTPTLTPTNEFTESPTPAEKEPTITDTPVPTDSSEATN